MPALDEIEVQSYIDSRSFSFFQWKVLALCFFVLVLDGFDVVIMGSIAPALLQDWSSTTRESLGVVISAGLSGLAIGALIGGPLADKFGRRRVIILSVFSFGLMSLLSAFSPDVTVLAIVRFLTGIGLGASQPNAATLANEYAPRKHRSLMVTTVYCGFAIGGTSAGFLASQLLLDHSWRLLLIIGGLMPMLYALALYGTLPESAKYLVSNEKNKAKIARIINAMSPGTVDDSTAILSTASIVRTNKTVSLILSKLHAKVTLSLWAGFFMTLLVAYFFNGWLPVLMTDKGFTASQGALVGGMFQAGGIVGIIVIGWEMDRFKAHKVLISTLGGAAIITLAIAQLNTSLYGLMALVFLLGYCINSTNTGWTAMAANYYPTQIRATGISWMTGVARFGAVIGAYGGGLLLSMKWPPERLIILLIVPIFIAVLASWIKNDTDQSSNT